MKGILYVLLALFLIGCAGTPGTNKKLNSMKDQFEEVHLLHDTKTGKTTLRFFGINDTTASSIKNSLDYTKYLGLKHFYLDQQYILNLEGTTVLEVQMVAKKTLTHQENIAELFSSIWGLATEVQDLEVDPMGIYMIGVIMENDSRIYAADTNARGFFVNTEEGLIMIQFNIFSEPMEIIMGYRQP